MMTSDKERREIARRLRAAAKTKSNNSDYLWRRLEIAVNGWRYGDAINDSYVFYNDVLARLADLIDPPEITEDTSDGYHTFGQLYYQRMVLFAVLVQEHKDCAWKSWNHEDGEPCFGGGWFLVTIDTPRGAYGYHFEEKYWRLFDCAELPKAKHWDGYTEENVNRLFSLNCYEVSGDAE